MVGGGKILFSSRRIVFPIGKIGIGLGKKKIKYVSKTNLKLIIIAKNVEKFTKRLKKNLNE